MMLEDFGAQIHHHVRVTILMFGSRQDRLLVRLLVNLSENSHNLVNNHIRIYIYKYLLFTPDLERHQSATSHKIDARLNGGKNILKMREKNTDAPPHNSAEKLRKKKLIKNKMREKSEG
jgi:hypothetical protein